MRLWRSSLLPVHVLDLYRVGDCPNVEMKTKGGHTFWDTLQVCSNGWKLQQNRFTKLCRILDENDVRKAWGNPFAMKEKLKRLTREEFLEAGDIIGVDRDKVLGVYQHYAVYLGNGRVIHYQAKNGDFFGGENSIHEAPFSAFLRDDEKYFVLLFDEKQRNVIKLRARTEFTEAEVLEKDSFLSIFTRKNYRLYTPKETIQRARGRIGEKKYRLFTRNCEHFAVWCKTGVSCSFQVKRVLSWKEIIDRVKDIDIFD